MNVKAGQILKYAVSPGIWPRLQDLFGSGFSLIAALIAYIFSSVRLLPSNHPYLRAKNYGCFGIRHVIAEAANHLILDKRHIDQILIFTIILTGLVLLLLQFFLLIFSIFQGPALAETLIPYRELFAIQNMFSNQNPDHDYVFMIMDKVFGAPDVFGGQVGFFESCISNPNINCIDRFENQIPTSSFPTPFHEGLHAMFSLYSYGVLMVGIIVILYFITTIVGETAVTGSPFGQQNRFNRAWMPIRLILFFALIIPLTSGLNAAQYITLGAAKYGSNFATNSWSIFTGRLDESRATGMRNLIATPTVPDLNNLLQFLFTARVCAEIESQAEVRDHGLQVKPYIVARNFNIGAVTTEDRERASFNMNEEFLNTSFSDALLLSRKGNITIHFGVTDGRNEDGESQYERFTGAVEPSCGILRMLGEGLAEKTAFDIQEEYYELVKDIYQNPVLGQAARSIIDVQDFHFAQGKEIVSVDDALEALLEHYRIKLLQIVEQAIEENQIGDNSGIGECDGKRGWGGAGICYARLGEINGAVTTAVFNLPNAFKYPQVTERAKKVKESLYEQTSEDAKKLIKTPDGKKIRFNKEIDYKIAKTLNEIEDIRIFKADAGLEDSENPVIQAINYIMGSGGIFDLRRDPDINPLAQLTMVGKSMIEAAARNLLIATGGRISQFFLDGIAERAAGTISGFLFSVVTISILIGFTLFYVLPFLPFVFFFFAVGGWVKSVFEAMVAMPLWALAHISRIDGEGIPGPAASNGYYLLLEIFIRPALIVVGLIGSVTIFSALVLALNDLFEGALTAISDHKYGEPPEGATRWNISYYRAGLDDFMFTIIYVAIVYLAALQSFKLIDQVPNQILRWIGQSVPGFQENAGDPASEISGKVYGTSQVALNQLGRSLQGKGPDALQDITVAQLNQS